MKYLGKTISTIVFSIFVMALSAETEIHSTEDIRSLHVARDGTLWAGSRGAGLSSWDGSRWQRVAASDLGLDSVSAIIPSTEGVLWFGGPGGVTRYDGETWRRFEQLGRTVRVVFGGVAGRDGTVWLGTNAGAVHFDGTEWQWLSEGLKHEVVHDIHRDRSGHLWFATRRGGLSRLRPDGTWSHALEDQNVRVIYEDESGDLWFGTSDGVFRLHDDRWEHYQAGGAVLPLFRDSDGTLWFARGAGGAWQYRAGEWTQASERLTSEIHAALETADGSLWFASSDGLRRLPAEGF